jgi:Lipase (class 3)
MDWAALALSCRRANAAYIENDDDAKAAFAKLGDTWIGQYQDSSHQACLSVDAHEQTWLSISGTRASDLQLGDVRRDVMLKSVAIKGGHVTEGAADGMQHVFDWALSTAPVGASINLTGHSLGAVSVTLAPAYMPLERIGTITSLAAPKFIAADFFATYAALFKRLTAVVNANDAWASWPWIDPLWQVRAPVPTVWLKDDQGRFEMLSSGNRWPGGMDFGDHDIDEYQRRIDKISAADLEPEAA